MCLAESRYVPFFRAATHDLVRLTGSSIGASLLAELRRMLKETTFERAFGASQWTDGTRGVTFAPAHDRNGVKRMREDPS